MVLPEPARVVPRHRPASTKATIRHSLSPEAKSAWLMSPIEPKRSELSQSRHLKTTERLCIASRVCAGHAADGIPNWIQLSRGSHSLMSFLSSANRAHPPTTTRLPYFASRKARQNYRTNETRFPSLCIPSPQVGDSTDTISPETSSKHHHHHHYHSTHGVKNKKVPVHEALNAAELFKVYNMLNGVKTDLLWGRNNEEQPEEIEMAQEQENIAAAAAVAAAAVSEQSAAAAATNCDDNKDCKGHARRPSTASVASSNSTTTISDSDSEISSENDSGIESERKPETDKSRDLAKQYRKHLLGLYRCLEQMTDAANYLTARYQSDIGPV